MKNLSMSVICLTLLNSCAGLFTDYEEADYKIEEQIGDIEIRSYSEYVIAKVAVDGTRDEAVNKGFKLLGGYIFGDNIAKEEISMTVPVRQKQKEKSQEIAMTVPVGQSKVGDKSSNNWQITFTMPSKYTIKTLPEPKNDKVKFERVSPYKAAVIVFSGFNSDGNIAEHRKLLKEFLDERKIEYLGNPTYAYYNPPWTPWFMKRNEVIYTIRD